MQYLAPHSFAEGLYELTDMAKEIESKYGKYYDQVNSSATLDGKYRAIPYNIVGNAFVYRKDFAQTFGDAPTFFYPLVWAHGGKEVQDDGKTVAINSKETIDTVKFAKACWDEGLDQRAASWDYSGNNTAFLADEISCTLNGASIFSSGRASTGRRRRNPGRIRRTTSCRRRVRPRWWRGSWTSRMAFRRM
jgi:multiple sugar transport system substrate-binding protein